MKMTTMGLASIRAQNIAKDTEEKRNSNREKAMLLFTFQLLLDKGYVDTATSFASECSLNLEQYYISDNIDLSTVFVDHEAYYNLRFQRYPQYFKKISVNAAVGDGLLAKLAKQKRGGGGNAKPNVQNRRSLIPTCENDYASSGEPCEGSIGSGCHTYNGVKDKLLKPVSGLDFLNEDMRYFADIIQKEIIVQDLDTKWEDVVGLENAKMIIMEAMVYRNELTQFFGEALPPWRGLLLYGPPGTGKTLLAKAVASETGATFFNISSSSLVSKWRGDSEKIVKMLFELAKYHAPSTIFFDEFDAIASNRDSLGESDASRRLKSELLQQIDGLLSNATQQESQIFILAATNLPWELDPAMIRRLEKRVHVPLPYLEERKQILQLNLAKIAHSISQQSQGRNCLICQIDFEISAQATEGYSGSDLHQLVKEIVIQKFRQSFKTVNSLRKLVIDSHDIAEGLKNCLPTKIKVKLSAKDTTISTSEKHEPHAKTKLMTQGSTRAPRKTAELSLLKFTHYECG